MPEWDPSGNGKLVTGVTDVLKMNDCPTVKKGWTKGKTMYTEIQAKETYLNIAVSWETSITQLRGMLWLWLIRAINSLHLTLMLLYGAPGALHCRAGGGGPVCRLLRWSLKLNGLTFEVFYFKDFHHQNQITIPGTR